VCSTPLVAPGQVLPGDVGGGGSGRELQLQREQRLRELEEFNQDRRIKPNEAVPLGERALVDYGAYLTFSYLSVRDGRRDHHEERIYEAAAYANVNFDNVHNFFVRGRYAYFDWSHQDDSFDGRGSRSIDDPLDRAYYRFDLGRYLEASGEKTGDSGLALQVGRDLVYWVNGLVLGQRLDGMILDAYSGPASVQVIAGVTPKYTVDFDPSRPDFDRNTRRGFFGAKFDYDLGSHKPFFYVLDQRDFNDDNVSYPLGSQIPMRFNYESYYIGFGSEGNLSDRVVYAVEAAYEGGSTLSIPYREVPGGGIASIPQTRDSIRAMALNARLEYILQDEYRTRFSLEETLATGDRDRVTSNQTATGNAPHTSDRAFNAFGLINPGLAFTPNLSNLSITRLGVATYPLPQSAWTRRLQLGFDFFTYFKLAQGSALEEASYDQSFVGVEPDVYLNWQLTSDLTVVFRYGYFFPGDALIVNDEHRHFFYGGITYAF
jgi:hypothetical protein